MYNARINFAHAGNPGSKWDPYELQYRSTMIFNYTSKIEMDPNREERLIWDDAYKSL